MTTSSSPVDVGVVLPPNVTLFRKVAVIRKLLLERLANLGPPVFSLCPQDCLAQAIVPCDTCLTIGHVYTSAGRYVLHPPGFSDSVLVCYR